MAYGRTFLQLVNDVLRELREPEVSTWDETDYSTMIGGFINSCKRDAENAWRWTALRDTFDITCTADVVTYSFTDTDERAQVLDAWNNTTSTELNKLTWRQMNRVYFGAATPASGNVDSWVPNGINASTGAYQVDVYPIPDSEQSLSFNVYAPQADLDADLDVMVVPHRPIVEGTLARARFERGEDGGVSFEAQAAFMAKALGDHIALDAANHVEDTQWEPV
jgi:hypothetical protein